MFRTAVLVLIGDSNVKMVNLSLYYHCESLQALKHWLVLDTHSLQKHGPLTTVTDDTHYK